MGGAKITFIHNFILLLGILEFYEFLITAAFESDNFALMSGTLKTFQVHACDDEELRIQCFPQTVISIKIARYGSLTKHNGLCKSDRNSISRPLNNTECLSVNALKVIEEKCQEQTICRLLTNKRVFQEDPCPGFRKYAEVAYKCRPVDFVNKIACEGESLSLSCTDTFRIFLYSANFGNSEKGVEECPETIAQENKEVCQSSFATERVIARCQGRQQCVISANTETFGNPGCSTSIPKYLKVRYICVPKEILLDLPSVDSGSESLKEIYTTSYPAWARGMDKQVPSYNKPLLYPTDNMQQDDMPTKYLNGSHIQDRKVVEFFSSWLSAHKFLTRNTQKLILYMAISLGIGITLFITVVVVHFYFINGFSGREKTKKIEIETNDAEDFFTDSDLEHFEGYDSNNHTMRKISDAIPRAPVTSQNSNHYFS